MFFEGVVKMLRCGVTKVLRDLGGRFIGIEQILLG